MRKELEAARKLSKLYIAALAAIALLVISGELLMQQALDRQTNDSRVVNIAGRQRMLSQKLSKEAMLIHQAKIPSQRKAHLRKFSNTLELWQRASQGLLHGNKEMGLPGKNSVKVSQMFDAVKGPFESMGKAASDILRTRGQKPIGRAVGIILQKEPLFLEGMNQIVFQYDQEAKSRVQMSKRIEWFLLWSALFVLLLEGFFLFRPAVRKLSRTLIHLKKERARAERLAGQLQIQNQKLKQAFTEIVEISEQERRRIAQDLHDQVSQEISGISCMVKALQKKMEARSIEGFTDLTDVSQLITETLAHTRDIARGLYPITIDGDGLRDKLKDLLANIEKMFQIHCRLTVPEHALPVQQHYATHLYCIIQEAIHNAVRHGKAKSIHVKVNEQGSLIRVSIADDGTGFPFRQEGEQGLGLRIMKYRSELIRGQLNFSKNELGGVTVICEIPRSLQNEIG